MTESTTHQLFATSTLHTKYPDYFTNSTDQKYVSVIAVHLFKEDVKIKKIAVDDTTGKRILFDVTGDGIDDISGDKIEPDPADTRLDIKGYRIYSANMTPPYTVKEVVEGEGTFDILQDCQLHADFVQDDECLQQYVCMANLPLYHKRKYKQYNNPRFFDVWFTDYKGTKIEFDSTYHFALELLLEY